MSRIYVVVLHCPGDVAPTGLEPVSHFFAVRAGTPAGHRRWMAANVIVSTQPITRRTNVVAIKPTKTAAPGMHRHC